MIKLKELTSTSATPGYNSKYAFKKKKKKDIPKSKGGPEGTGKNRDSNADLPLLKKPKKYGSLMTLLRDTIREIVANYYKTDGEIKKWKNHN